MGHQKLKGINILKHSFDYTTFIQRGVTLIELVLYIAIISIFMTTIVSFAWNMVEGSAKSDTQQEVYSQARYLSERIKYEIRNASSINTSDFGINFATDPTKQLSLTNAVTGTIIFRVNASGKATITQGATTTLNSNSTRVTDLTFTNYTSLDNKTKHIGLTLTVTSNYSQVRNEFRETITLRSSAELRSN